MMSDEFLELVKDDEKLRAVYNKLSEEGRLMEVVKTYSKSDEWEERYLAAKLLKLIPIEKMDDDLKAALLRLMLIWDDDINKAAEEAAKEHDYSSPQEVYDDLSEGRREKVKEELRTYSQHREWRERYLAAKLLKLIPKKEMTDDLKVIELLLMFDWKEDVSKAAEEAAKKHGCSSAEERYKNLSKVGKVALRKEVQEYSKSGGEQAKYIALVAIGGLGLIDFIDRVIELCRDWYPSVKERAFETLEELAKRASLGKIVVNEDVKKKITSVIKTGYGSGKWNKERYLAAKLLKLIPKKEMTDDLKVIELLLMFDWKEDVSKAAEEAAKALYESLSKEGKVALKKELKEYLMSCVWQDRCLALKVIGCLGLIDFIDRVVELCDDQDLDVKERAFKTLEEFGKGMVSGKIVARKEHLDMLINMFSNRVQYQELLEKLMRLRDELNSTQIDADGAFSGRKQERKGSPKKLKQRDK